MASAQRTTHLGRYEPLVAAVREELEQFVTNELRLHLAIAERDRYLLTSIEVECADERTAPRAAAPLHRRVQARADQALPRPRRDRRAAQCECDRSHAICRPQRRAGGARGGRARPYDALLAQLQSVAADATVRPYAVTLVGRWSEALRRATALSGAAHAPRHEPRAARSSHTPLAGRSLTLELEDARGGPPGRARRRGSGPPIRRRQGRELRRRGRWCVREPAALRALVRQGDVVGDRRGIDQRHSRRMQRQRASACACAGGQRRMRRSSCRRARSSCSRRMRRRTAQYPRISMPATSPARRARAGAGDGGHAHRTCALASRSPDRHRAHGVRHARRRDHRSGAAVPRSAAHAIRHS